MIDKPPFMCSNSWIISERGIEAMPKASAAAVVIQISLVVIIGDGLLLLDS